VNDVSQRVLLVGEPDGGRAGEVLAAAGFVVARAGDAGEVAAALAEAPPDLCIAWAAGEETVALCGDIRSGSRGALVPLLLVGGPGTAVESRPRALEVGADSFLDREETGEHLLSRVRTLLGVDESGTRDPLEQALAAAEAVAPAATDSRPPLAGTAAAVGSVSVLEVIAQAQRRLDEDPGADPDRHPPVEEDTADSGTAAAAMTDEPGAGSAVVDAGRGRPWLALAGALAARRDGVLVIRRGGVERRLFFERGEVVMAVSTAREDRLVELLYREGRLTEEQYRQAVLTVGASGRRVGAVLVERGFIASRELFPLVRHHYETLVYDSFSWRDCEWHFADGARQMGERILLDVPTAALIVEGIRSRAGREEVDALVAPGSRPCLLEHGIAPLEDVGLPAEERQILDLCDGSLSTRRLAERGGMPEDEVRALLAGLAILGWVRAGGGVAAGAVDDEPPPHSRAAVEAGLRVERARVEDKLAVAGEGSYFALLEVPPEASGHEIRKAYRRLRAQFAPERFAVDELADLRDAAEVVRLLLDEAYEVLRDQSLREAYREARHGTGAAVDA